MVAICTNYQNKFIGSSIEEIEKSPKTKATVPRFRID